MRPKIYSILALAVLLAAAVFWREKHLAVRTVKQPPVAGEEAVSAPLPASPAPENPGKMRPVMDRPVSMRPALPTASVSGGSPVLLIVDSQIPYEQRLKAIDALGGVLTEMDWGLLKQFLTTPDSLDRAQQQQVIKNRLLDMLCAVEPPPDGLGKVLTQMYRDDQQADVIRDYAVQHMAAYYEQMESQPGSAKLLQADVDVLWEAAKETRDSIGGTALLGLQRLSQENGSGIDRTKIEAAAVDMAGDDKAGELTHITAFQVCAQQGAAEALPVIVQAAEGGETIPVRMSAIGALGSLGGSDQIPLLSGLAAGSEERLRPVAQHALEQVLTRQEQAISQK